MAAAWSLSVSERQAEGIMLAEQISTDVRSSLDDQVEAAAIICTAAFFADRLDHTVEILNPWLQQIDSAPLIPRQAMTNHRASHALRQGRPELARQYCQKMHQIVAGEDFDALAGYRDWVVGLSYFWEGHVLNAESSLRASSKRADQMLGRRSNISVLLATTLAAVLFERNATLEAATVLANRIDVLAERVAPEGIMFGYVTASRLASLQGHDHRAHDLLNELYALGEARQMPRLIIAAQVEQIRLHALRNHGETCQSLWHRLERGLPNFVRAELGLLGKELALYVHLGHAFSAVASHAWQDALNPLTQAARLADQMRRGRESVQVKLLQALVFQNLKKGSVNLLCEATSLAKTLGLQRVVLDTHPDLFAWAETTKIRPAKPAIAHDQSPQDEGDWSGSTSCNHMLTPKEREILHLLSRHMTNKEIGQVLNIGEETVKWHMKNILSKFQVGNRKDLINRAYLLGAL
jgi:LuxR family maltose regulon positive regulatory protein